MDNPRGKVPSGDNYGHQRYHRPVGLQSRPKHEDCNLLAQRHLSERSESIRRSLFFDKERLESTTVEPLKYKSLSTG